MVASDAALLRDHHALILKRLRDDRQALLQKRLRYDRHTLLPKRSRDESKVRLRKRQDATLRKVTALQKFSTFASFTRPYF